MFFYSQLEENLHKLACTSGSKRSESTFYLCETFVNLNIWFLRSLLQSQNSSYSPMRYVSTGSLLHKDKHLQSMQTQKGEGLGKFSMISEACPTHTCSVHTSYYISFFPRETGWCLAHTRSGTEVVVKKKKKKKRTLLMNSLQIGNHSSSFTDPYWWKSFQTGQSGIKREYKGNFNYFQKK